MAVQFKHESTQLHMQNCNKMQWKHVSSLQASELTTSLAWTLLEVDSCWALGSVSIRCLHVVKVSQECGYMMHHSDYSPDVRLRVQLIVTRALGTLCYTEWRKVRHDCQGKTFD